VTLPLRPRLLQRYTQEGGALSLTLHFEKVLNLLKDIVALGLERGITLLVAVNRHGEDLSVPAPSSVSRSLIFFASPQFFFSYSSYDLSVRTCTMEC